MDFLSNTLKKIKSGSKTVVPKVARAAKSSVSTISNIGSILVKKEDVANKYNEIASVLEQTDIKFGDKYLLKDDEALDQYLSSSKPKDIVKALNTILSVLVYSANGQFKNNSAPKADSNLSDDVDLKTRVLTKFYPNVVKCINNENKEVKKLAMLIISQTFTENSDATILCINSLLKEVAHGDAERRANGLRLMSSIANNDTYPFIYTHILKGMNDLNPYVRRAAYTGLLKLCKNTEFGSSTSYAPDEDDDDESEADTEDTSTDDLCLRLLSNTLHNVSEEEKEVGGQSIKAEDNENILALSIYLLEQVIAEDSSKAIEEKYKTLHPVFFTIMEKLDEIDESFISQIVPILIKYTKRYFGSRIVASRRNSSEETSISKEHAKILEFVENALDGLDNPSAVLALSQFYLIISPIHKMHEIISHLIRVYKQAEIEGGFENEIVGFSTLHFIENIVKNDTIMNENPKIIKQLTSLRFIKNLFLKSGQAQFYCCKKLFLLDMLCDRIRDNSVVRKIILEEFYYQSKNSSMVIGLLAVEAIRNCGLERLGIDETSKSLFYPSIKCLVRIVKSNRDDRILGRCVQNLHQMLLKDKSKTKDIVYYLVSMLSKITAVSARARIIKLIIDYIDHFKTLARETYRKLVKGFLNEKAQVKFQIIQLGITLMLIDYQDENDKLEAIFNYMLDVAILDADYSIKTFTRMVKGIFIKDTILGGEIKKKNVFSPVQITPVNGKLVSEYDNVELPNQNQVDDADVLGNIDSEYLPSLSSVLKIHSEKSMRLDVEACNEEQQQMADDFNCRLAPTQDIMFSHSVYSEGTKIERTKQNQSIGFAVENAKGKVIQSLGSENVKVIEGNTTLQSKYKESYAFKDKKQLKKDLESWFDDDDEEEKLQIRHK